MTVRDLLDRWLAARRPRLRPTSVARYEFAARAATEALGDRPVSELRPEEAEALDPYPLLVLRRATRWAALRGLLDRDPLVAAEPPRTERREIEPPPAELVGLLVRRAYEQSARWGAFVELAAVTGARRGELCGLKWTDIDWERGKVRIARQRVSVGSRVHEYAPKAGSARVIAVPGSVLGTLARLPRASEYVFPWRPAYVAQKWLRLCASIGARVRLHDLRHFSATQLLAAGVPLREVMGRHGWRSISSVLDRYASWAAQHDEAAAHYLATLLEAQGPGHRR